MFRILLGVAIIILTILLDHHGSCIGLLLAPGLFIIVVALMDLYLLAPVLRLPTIGEKLRIRYRWYSPRENRLSDLTYIWDRLRENSPNIRHPRSLQALQPGVGFVGDIEGNS